MTSTKSDIKNAMVLGSSRVTLLVANEVKNLEQPHIPTKYEVLGCAQVPCSALRRGEAIDLEELSESIIQAIERVEKQSQTELKSVRVCIAHPDVRHENLLETVQIRNQNVKAADITRLEGLIESRKASPGYHVINAIQGNFVVDAKRYVRNPMHMSAESLGLHMFRVSIPNSVLENLNRAVNSTGLNIEGYVLESLAAAEGCLHNDEKSLGICSLNFGADFVHLAAYWDDKLQWCKELPFGSQYITRDLSIGLRISQESAELIKLKHGICLPLSEKKEQKIQSPSIIQGENQEFSVGEMSFIIEQRVKEILWKVQRTLEEHKILKQCARGIVVSGGGSLLEGFEDMCAQVFETPIRKGEPRNLTNLPKGVPSLCLTSSSGLLSPTFFPTESELSDAEDLQNAGLGGVFKEVWKKIKEPFVTNENNHF